MAARLLAAGLLVVAHAVRTRVSGSVEFLIRRLGLQVLAGSCTDSTGSHEFPTPGGGERGAQATTEQ